MKRLILIFILCSSFQIILGQTNLENVWLTIYKGDSILQEKYLGQISFDKENAHYRIQFDQNADTTETVITFYDKNGNDSIQIWKYLNDTASYTLHWTYNDKSQLIRKHTSRGALSYYDTIIYQYNSDNKHVKETYLFKSFHPYDSLIYQEGNLKEVISYTPDEISNRKKYKYTKNSQLKNITTFNEKGQKLRKTSICYNSEDIKTKIKTIRYKTIYTTKQIEVIKNFKYSKSSILQEFNIIYYNRNYGETIFYNENGEKIKLIRKDLITDEMTIKEFERKTLHNEGRLKTGD
ncbi:MAG: hypothetical protein H8D45_15265 [Bacteroidetes bacterium]|nr:hypothetical protein [Bacteroidota bacterium]MBL7103890.1 hypothetical protein [Bacteroidales bacterium]